MENAASCGCKSELVSRIKESEQRELTFDSSVSLDEHLASFLAKQHCLTESQEIVNAVSSHGRVAVIQSSASLHISRGLVHLGKNASFKSRT